MVDEALLKACWEGNLPAVERLLDNGADPAAENNYAIKWAAANGHLKVVERLLQDPRVDPAADNSVAVRWAAEDNHLDVVERLLQISRVNPAADDNITIRCVAENGHLEVMERLLQDPRVNPAADNNDAIRRASGNGYLEVVERLLQDNRVVPPRTALCDAAMHGHAATLQMLMCDWRIRSMKVPLDMLLKSRYDTVQGVLRVWREDVGL